MYAYIVFILAVEKMKVNVIQVILYWIGRKIEFRLILIVHELKCLFSFKKFS